MVPAAGFSISIRHSFTSGLLFHKFQKRLSCRGRGRRILASNEMAVSDRKSPPVRFFLKDRAEPRRFIFDLERHNLDELHLLYECKLRGREFFEPKTSRAARVSQLVVRCQDHQYFHMVLQYSSRRASRMNRRTSTIRPEVLEKNNWTMVLAIPGPELRWRIYEKNVLVNTKMPVGHLGAA
jgi:hypothetical protein